MGAAAGAGAGAGTGEGTATAAIASFFLRLLVFFSLCYLKIFSLTFSHFLSHFSFLLYSERESFGFWIAKVGEAVNALEGRLI